jgi:hypothetical protein
MTNENLVHIKLEYGESLEAKKDILYLESTLLKTLRIIKEYHSIRMEELKLKMNFSKKIKSAENAIKNLKAEIPRVGIPRILKNEISPLEFKKENISEDDLEGQLKEINDKLKLIGK